MLPLDESESGSIGQPTFLKRRDIIATVIEIIRGAWVHVCKRKDVNAKCDEITIAGVLHIEMCEERKRRGISGPPLIVNEPATRKSKMSFKPDGFIDFQVFYGFDEQEYFGIECKRVSSSTAGKDKGLATEYVSNGMMRFVDGVYSSSHDFAAMLGFAIDGNPSGCIERIKKRIKTRHKDICLEEDWTEEKSFGLHPHLYRSRHRQPAHKNSITLLHLFVNFDDNK